jgi:hypothetical protein
MKKIDNNIAVSPTSLKHIYTIGGMVSLIIVGFYVTGIYRNYLQIKKLKED